MPNPTFRCSEEFLGRLKETASHQNVTMSDFVRTSVGRYIEQLENPQDIATDATVAVLQSHVKKLHDELSTKNAQIDQLHQIVAMAQSNQADTLKQLQASKARRRWWFWRAERVKP